MSRRSRSARVRALLSRSAVAGSLVAILLIAAPQIAAAVGPASGKLAGTLSITDMLANEGDSGTTTFTFTVTHSGTSDPFYVDGGTAGGTAISGPTSFRNPPPPPASTARTARH